VSAQTSAPSEILDHHPLAGTIAELRTRALAVDSFRDSRLNKADYLPLIAANIDFFKQHQNANGAIIDPYDKHERQYSTPAFALDAAIVVRDLKREDLLEPATRAMTFAVAALANHTTADGHADFYIPLIMHARRILKDRVPAETLATWDEQLRGLVPERTYRDTGANNNWNLVNVCGELLRRQDGLVPQEQLAPQLAYIDKSLASQLKHFTPMGMFTDPNSPLAYDAFPRLWLEDVTADGAYSGLQSEQLRTDLTLGGLTTLLLFSPSGEWPSGGRSAQHQWNEAAVAVIAECNAIRWKAAGQNDLAGMFKRTAHLALESIRRWQRPSGELWIVKNCADPANRHGYEGYSYHSQYNLLAMAMLAIAHERADDSIREVPIPSEFGQYIADLRSTFHKVFAAAAGNYIEIDTAADTHFNATGLQRFHKRGVPLSPLSDSVAGDRTYGPDNTPKAAITPGIQWKTSPQDKWHSLASETVDSCDLLDSETTPGVVKFKLRYTLKSAAGMIEQQWKIDAEGIDCSELVSPAARAVETRFIFPAMVSDGAKETKVSVDGSKLSIDRAGGSLAVQIVSTPTKFVLEGDSIPTHNGFVRAAVAELPDGARIVRWRAKLSPGQ
jgi:hypothetical protein